MAGKPWLSPSPRAALTSRPNQAQSNMLGERCQRISTTFETQPIPALSKSDSHWGFRLRLSCDSLSETVGGLRWVRRLGFGRIFGVGFAGFGAAERGCGSGAQAFGFGGDLRGGTRRWQTAWGCRRCATGCCGSTRGARRGCPADLNCGKAAGKLARLNAVQREALAGVVQGWSRAGFARGGALAARSGGPIWRIADLVAWLHTTFEVTVSPQTLSRERRALGYPQAVGAAAPPCPGRRGRLPILKKLSRRTGRGQARPPTRNAGRVVVAGVRHGSRHRSEAHGGRAGWPEDRNSKALGLFLVAQFAPKTGRHFSDCA